MRVALATISTVTLAVLAVSSPAACEPSARWEHKTVYPADPAFALEAPKLKAEGWEVVSCRRGVAPNELVHMCVLRRERR